jgi:hypothetical protein
VIHDVGKVWDNVAMAGLTAIYAIASLMGI